MLMTLIAPSGEELFYEMVILSTLKPEQATASTLWRLVKVLGTRWSRFFSELKDGIYEQLHNGMDSDGSLTEHEFGYRERTAYTMKRMLFSYP